MAADIKCLIIVLELISQVLAWLKTNELGGHGAKQIAVADSLQIPSWRPDWLVGRKRPIILAPHRT
jgi:hypothetical protein